MKAYKGFNKDMTCRGYQYKEGETYTTDKAKMCYVGFHACENPIDCLRHYEPHNSVYHEVELDGEIVASGSVAATLLREGAVLNVFRIVAGG